MIYAAKLSNSYRRKKNYHPPLISPKLLTQLQGLTKHLPCLLRKPRKAKHLHRKSLRKLNHPHCTSPARNVNGYALKARKEATSSYVNCAAKRNNSSSLASHKLHHLRSQMPKPKPKALPAGSSRRAHAIYRLISMTRQLRCARYTPAVKRNNRSNNIGS